MILKEKILFFAENKKVPIFHVQQTESLSLNYFKY